MEFRINGLTSPALNEVVESRLTAALDQHQSSVDHVTVRLSDVNGHRGGVDKLCRVAVRLRDSSEVLIEERGADLYAVASTAAERVKQAVGRRVEKGRDRHGGFGAP